MPHHLQPRLCHVSEISDHLKFRLTAEQRAKAGRKPITFRKSTQPKKGYKQLYSRAEYNSVNPKTGKFRAKPAAGKLIGIIWDDDPQWVYETDKSRSPKADRRKKALAQKLKPQRATAEEVTSKFEEKLELDAEEIHVKTVPISLLLTVALICAITGKSDATSVASYWNVNLNQIKELYPEKELESISHDTVRRVYMGLTENSVQEFLLAFFDWLPKWQNGEHRHIAVDGQTCRASRNHDDDRRLMTLNAVDVTAGRLCTAHMMIPTKSTEPKYVPELISKFDIQGATVTLDALNTTVPVAQAIIDNGAYYLLPTKGNQPSLHEAVVEEVTRLAGEPPKLESRHKEHGRHDGRQYAVVPAAGLSQEILDKWPGLAEGALVRARTNSVRAGKDGYWRESDEYRYFISCHPYEDTEEFKQWLTQCVRSHWGVEIFHGTLDAIWRQDQMQCRYPAYLRTRSTLAKIAHNLLVTLQRIDQEERNVNKPRSLNQLSFEIGATPMRALEWLGKIIARRESFGQVLAGQTTQQERSQ